MPPTPPGPCGQAAHQLLSRCSLSLNSCYTSRGTTSRRPPHPLRSHREPHTQQPSAHCRPGPDTQIHGPPQAGQPHPRVPRSPTHSRVLDKDSRTFISLKFCFGGGGGVGVLSPRKPPDLATHVTHTCSHTLQYARRPQHRTTTFQVQIPVLLLMSHATARKSLNPPELHFPHL